MEGPRRGRASIADDAPDLAHPGGQPPRLTIPMVARLQGFPDAWEFSGRKTAAYRQVGNAFPPPVAKAIGTAIATALGRPPELHPAANSRRNPGGR